MNQTRRHIIGGLGALTLGGCASLAPRAPSQLKLGHSRLRLDDMFTLGVASGDPVSDGFVIWTRLVPDPLGIEGVAGSGLDPVMPVHWQISQDDRFSHIIREGRTRAVADWAHSVHVEVSGLEPLRVYYYRFIADGQVSPVGRAKTAPRFGAPTERVRFGLASCQHYEQGFFNAYRDMVSQDPDIIVHLGDYIYESSWGPQVRRQAVTEAMSLGDYRHIHAQYKLDPHLQEAHAHAPWLFIWDDHEVANDYAGDNDENYLPPAQARARRAAAYQAYYEHMPVRLRSRPRGSQMRFYDYFHYGDLMTIALTDGRQYRTDHACQTPEDGGGRVVSCSELNDPSRSMFGPEQERWLMSSLARSGAKWEVLAQPTLFSRLFQKDRHGVSGSWSDGWDGYPNTRAMILDAVAQRNPKNFVSIGGDMHSWWQADLKSNYNDPESETIGSEFVVTSVTAHSYAYNRFNNMLPDNPHIHFFDDRKRGYGLVDVSQNEWKIAMREMSDVYNPDAKATTRVSYVIEDGQRGATAI